MPARDWNGEIDRWTERFAGLADPPEPFATALREGWTPEAREALAAAAEDYITRHRAYVQGLRDNGMDLVRMDAKLGDCGVCRPLVGKAFSLAGSSDEVPMAPDLPICPACRHTLNLLTPFFLQSLGMELSELAPDVDPTELSL